jgi:hypothetical protein
MEWVFLGGFALVALALLLWAFLRADPKALAKGLRYLGAGALVLAALALAYTDRAGMAAFTASLAWALFTGGHAWPGGWPHYNFPGMPRRRAATGQSTSVRTDWLEMELDHDSGEMRGRVLKGAQAGKALDALSKSDLLALYRDASGDSETARLLEAYLDRKLGADWRQAREEPRARASSGMTRDEAYRVLGLQSGAGEDEIRAAHRKLMLQNHPDRGGSDYLASKINEAKDVLLGP